MDEISEFFLFTVTDGGHFEFYAPENSARLFERDVGAYFFTNTLSYLKQPSNVTCRRLVTESWFWTLLYTAYITLKQHYVKATFLSMMYVIFQLSVCIKKTGIIIVMDTL